EGVFDRERKPQEKGCMKKMPIRVPESWGRLFGRAGESVTRSDRRERELEFGSPFPPLTARPNRRRERVRIFNSLITAGAERNFHYLKSPEKLSRQWGVPH